VPPLCADTIYAAAGTRDIAPVMLRLRRYAKLLTRSMTDADDLIQETMLRALSKLHLWQPRSDLRAWLFTIMRNQHMNEIRRQARARRLLAGVDVDPVRSGNQISSLELSEVAVALSQLPAQQRSIILLIAVDGVSYAEAADRLGVPVGTVRSRLSRARTALQQTLDPLHGNVGPGAPPRHSALRRGSAMTMTPVLRAVLALFDIRVARSLADKLVVDERMPPAAAQRALDVAASLGRLAVLAPVFAGTAIAVALDGGRSS
jgi:RNA polymerase sigma-70 factor, ECF subfamily